MKTPLLYWNIDAHVRRLGFENPMQLSTFAGITYQKARRIWANEAIERVDRLTLFALAEAFGVMKEPFTLLRVAKD